MIGPRPAAAGTVEPGFEQVAEAFELQLGPRGGSAFAAVVDGRPVVDVWGGAFDQRSAAVVFSGTKGVVATLLLIAADRSAIDLDAPVARSWPEFGAAGKRDITVAQLLAHAGGLPAVDQPIGDDELADMPRIAALLAAQAPMLPPGTPSYHALTYGWLAAELLRRGDGRTPGRMLAQELAGPLGLDLAIGLPPGDPLRGHVERVVPSPDFQLGAFLADDPDPRLLLVYGNPPRPLTVWDDPGMLGFEVPAANAVATARSMAAMYGALAGPGRPVSQEMLDRGRTEQSSGIDPLTGRPLRFGPTGYELHGTPSELGPPDDAFGHTGSGGTSHGAWPSLRTGFSFVTTDLRPESADGRAGVLLRALHDAVAE